MFQPFFAWHEKELRRIHPEDVVALKVEENYTKIFLNNGSYLLARSTLSAAAEKLPAELFVRIHRSILASVLYIDNVQKDNLLINGEPAPIGKQYYRALLERLNVID